MILTLQIKDKINMTELKELIDTFSTVLCYRENMQRSNLQTVAFLTHSLINIYASCPLDLLKEMLDRKISGILGECMIGQGTEADPWSEERAMDALTELGDLAAVYVNRNNEKDAVLYKKICDSIITLRNRINS